MIPLAKEENKYYNEKGTCHICGEKFLWLNLEELVIANAT